MKSKELPYAASANVDDITDFDTPSRRAEADPDNVHYPSWIVDGAQLSAGQQKTASLLLGLPHNCQLKFEHLVVPFTVTQPAEALQALVNLTETVSLGVLRPQIQAYQNGSLKVHLHCAQLPNWIDPFSSRWIGRHFEVTSVLAVPVCGNVGAGKHTDLVCHLVDAPDAQEAGCLQEYMAQDLAGRFPLLNRATPSSKATPKSYCYLLVTPWEHHWPSVVFALAVLVVLVVLVLAIIAIYRCCCCCCIKEKCGPAAGTSDRCKIIQQCRRENGGGELNGGHGGHHADYHQLYTAAPRVWIKAKKFEEANSPKLIRSISLVELGSY